MNKYIKLCTLGACVSYEFVSINKALFKIPQREENTENKGT